MTIFKLLESMKKASPVDCYCSIREVYQKSDTIVLIWEFENNPSYQIMITKELIENTSIDPYKHVMTKAFKAFTTLFKDI